MWREYLTHSPIGNHGKPASATARAYHATTLAGLGLQHPNFHTNPAGTIAERFGCDAAEWAHMVRAQEDNPTHTPPPLAGSEVEDYSDLGDRDLVDAFADLAHHGRSQGLWCTTTASTVDDGTGDDPDAS